MSEGFASLDAHIARLRALPALVPDALPELAEVVEQNLERTIRAGTDANGVSWQPRKDGGTPLATAGKSLGVAIVGTTIFCRLRGHVARHHLGRAKGGVIRHILPVDGLPPAMAAEIRESLARHFHERMGGV